MARAMGGGSSYICSYWWSATRFSASGIAYMGVNRGTPRRGWVCTVVSPGSGKAACNTYLRWNTLRACERPRVRRGGRAAKTSSGAAASCWRPLPQPQNPPGHDNCMVGVWRLRWNSSRRWSRPGEERKGPHRGRVAPVGLVLAHVFHDELLEPAVHAKHWPALDISTL
jgi:hypothetical protein